MTIAKVQVRIDSAGNDGSYPDSATPVIRFTDVTKAFRRPDGRGDFVASAAPAHWLAAIEESLTERARQIEAAWVLSRTSTAEECAAAVLPIVRAAGRSVLGRLYPDSSSMLIQAPTQAGSAE